MIRSLRLLVAATVGALAGCVEHQPAAPTNSPSDALKAAIACQADVRARTVTCQNPTPAQTSGARVSSDLVVGGQGVLVALLSSSVAYKTTTNIFSVDVAAVNLTSQSLNSPDVFFFSGPTVTGGMGTVTVENPTGTGTFLGASEPYFQYATLAYDTPSLPMTWEFSVPGTVTSFAFQVYVDAQVAQPTAPLIQWAADVTGDANPERGVWSTSTGDVFVVGLGGKILHRGSGASGTWQTEASGTEQDLYGVWATSAGPLDTVFAVGENGIILENTITWTPAISGTADTLYGIWGMSGSDVYAVGAGGTICHFNGAVWSTESSGSTADLYGVWGYQSGGTEYVFAVGHLGTILEYTSVSGNWTALTSKTVVNLYGISGTSTGTEIFVPGDVGTMLESTDGGDTWTSQTIRNKYGQSQPLYSVTVAPSGMYASGGAGTLLFYNSMAMAWDTVRGSGLIPNTLLYGVSATTTDAFAVGAGAIVDYNILSAMTSVQTNPTQGTVQSVWAADATDVFAASAGSILYYNGTSWSTQLGGEYPVYGLWGSGATDVFAVGYAFGGSIDHYAFNTTTMEYAWSSEQPPSSTDSLFSVWGPGGGTVYAVGAPGLEIIETTTDGTGTNAWKLVPATVSTSLYGIWGTSASNIFAVGAGGTIFYYNGTTWAAQASGTTQTLFGVWGSSSTNVYAVGVGGTILNYNGTTWAAQTSTTGLNLYAVWGTSATDVYTVGASGTIVHWDGGTWVTQPSGTSNTLYAVGGTGSGSTETLFAGGANGTLLRGQVQ